MDIPIEEVIMEKPFNTAVYVFEKENNGWTLKVRNCKKHLDI